MIPQERGLEGLRIYFIFLNHPFCLMEEISYVSFLGEGHDVLNPHDLHKHVLGLLGGFSHSLILSFIGSFVDSRSRPTVGRSTYSCIHSCTCSLFTPLMETSLHSLSHYTRLPHSRLVWEGETNTIKFERFCDEVETNFRQHRVVFANKIKKKIVGINSSV
jgi:hypothetical protein